VSSSDTGYGSYDVRQLWQMVDTAKRTVAESHQQIRAWNIAHQMLEGHHEKLRSLRNQLEQLWPPAENPASAAYLGHLDGLLLAVDQTSVASKANADQAVFVTQAIDDAHAALTPLRDEYDRNEQKLASYKAQIDTVGQTATIVGGFGTGLLVKGGAKIFTSPPVDDGRQDEINRLARDAMAPLSGAAQDADWNMIPPPEYKPPTVETKADITHLGEDSDGGALRPPPVAPPAHTNYASDRSAGHGPGRSVPAGGREAPDGSRPPRNDGPILSGGAMGAPPPPDNVTTPPPAPPPPQPGGGTGSPPRPVIGMGPPFGGLRPWAGGGTTPPPMPMPPGGARLDLEAGRIRGALPSGSILGMTAGDGIVSGGGTSGRRVNPVGGLLGREAGASASGQLAGGGIRRAGKNDGRKRPTWDPDNPWAVDHGVAPVIEPAAEPDFRDPGPGVIGIDR
jgi:hypothetical protein